MIRGILVLAALTLVLGAHTLPAGAVDPSSQALEWLHAQQRSDGSFGIGGQGSPAMTADVVYTLALIGEDPAGPHWSVNGRSALGALEALAVPYANRDAGQAGKVARAVASAGGNPRSFAGLDLIQVIQAAYDPSTGRYHPQLLYRHTLAIEGLLRSGQPVPERALEALLSAQLSDGGWFWSFDGVASDVDSTGRVLQVLAAHAGISCVPRLYRGVDFLATAQLEDGGWGVYSQQEPGNANSTALAIAGLKAVGADPASARFRKGQLTPEEALQAFQELAGSFVYTLLPGYEESRLLATLDALNAFGQPLRQASLCTPRYLPVLLAWS